MMSVKKAAMLIAIVAGFQASVVYGYTNTETIARAPNYGFGNQSISMLNESRGNPIGNGRAFTLGYQATVGTDNNVDRSNTNEESASYVRFSPYAGLSKSLRDHRFWLNAKAGVSKFDSGKDDDFSDLLLQAAGTLNTHGMHRFEFDGGFRKGHHVFNVERAGNAGVTNENLDRFDQPGLRMRYILGRPSARLHFSVSGQAYDREYQNNRYATRYYDHQTKALNFGVGYQLAQKTSVIAGIGSGTTEFDETEAGFTSRDFVTNRVFAGLRWQATSKTAGEFRFGYRDTDYDSANFNDVRRAYWNLLVDWRPRLRDTVRFSTSRSQEVSRFSNVADIELTQYTVRWIHNWRRRIQTRLGLDYVDTGYDFDSNSRNDDMVRYVAGIRGRIGEKSHLGLGYVRSERNSSSLVYEYDAERYEITLEAHF